MSRVKAFKEFSWWLQDNMCLINMLYNLPLFRVHFVDFVVALAMKQPAPFFVSYAHHDSSDAERFLTTLEPLLRTSSEFAFSRWMDHQLLPGDYYLAEINQAIEHSRFGLILVSPALLASGFILRNELPALLGKGMVVPVELQRIVFDGSMDLKGLESRQVFRDSRRRSFDACRTIPDRRAFALDLFSKIVALLRRNPC